MTTIITVLRRQLLLVCLLAGGITANAQVFINEYSCANWRQFYDIHTDTEDWVELYNAADVPADISGYYLSDNEDKPTKWAFPANTVISPKGYLLVWCSGRDTKDDQGIVHTSFRLTQTRNNPEHIVFSDASGNLLEDISIEKTQAAHSRARVPDGGDWFVCIAPTLGTANNAANTRTGYADRPDMDKPAGFYSGPQTIVISTNEPDAVIRYTLNGSEPTATSSVYTQPITITKTTVIKAQTFSNNPQVHRSFVQFNTYFIDEVHTLAVVSVASNEVETLANGDNTLRPMGSIEYFDKEKQRKTRAYGELNSHGQDSWQNDQRSLDWVTRDEMGYNYALRERLFPLTERDEFQRVILRASGDDNYPAAHHAANEGSAHVRDAYIQNLAKRGHLNVDVRTSEKCIVYLNGKYWGVYDLREIPDEHDYTDYYYNQGKYELEYVLTWGGTWAEYGGDQALINWGQMKNFIFNNNMNNPDKFKYVEDRYDYKSLIDYVIVNSFTVCTDWLNYNTGVWRGLNPEGEHRKWGYILWDNDATFDFYINYTGLPTTDYTAWPCNPEALAGGSDPQQHIHILNKLRTNPVVDQYYVTRMADLMYTVFGCDNMLSYLDTIENTIDPEMARHAVRWFGTYAEWKNNIDRLRDFITNRCAILPSLMDECYTVQGPYQTNIVVDPPLSGRLDINTLTYTADQFPHTRPYFGGTDAPLYLQARADTAQGYHFSHWTAGHHTFSNPDTAIAYLQLSAADTIVAHFAKQTSAVLEPQAKTNSTFAVSPTIFDQQIAVNFSLDLPSNVTVQLYDMTGNPLVQQSVKGSTGKGLIQLDLSGKTLPNGCYVVRCSAGDVAQTFRLIKIHQ